MESRDFIKLTRKILDSESGARERAVDEVTDLLGAYSPAQVSTLAVLLSALAACEEENSVLEAELHAILELMSTGHISIDDVAHLREIRIGELPAELREYVTDLLDG